eukprot:2501102-Rhodomonas_salina.1
MKTQSQALRTQPQSIAQAETADIPDAPHSKGRVCNSRPPLLKPCRAPSHSPKDTSQQDPNLHQHAETTPARAGSPRWLSSPCTQPSLGYAQAPEKLRHEPLLEFGAEGLGRGVPAAFVVSPAWALMPTSWPLAAVNSHLDAALEYAMPAAPCPRYVFNAFWSGWASASNLSQDLGSVET